MMLGKFCDVTAYPFIFLIMLLAGLLPGLSRAIAQCLSLAVSPPTNMDVEFVADGLILLKSMKDIGKENIKV